LTDTVIDELIFDINGERGSMKKIKTEKILLNGEDTHLFSFLFFLKLIRMSYFTTFF